MVRNMVSCRVPNGPLYCEQISVQDADIVVPSYQWGGPRD